MKKVLNIIKTVLIWMIVVFAVLMMVFTLISVNTFDKTDANLFGYQFYVVKTDSMAATDFAAGDVIIVKAVDDLNTLEKGDIITFVSENEESRGEIITHKIYEKTKDANGNIAFRTYGTTNVKDINNDGKIEGVEEHQCDKELAVYVQGKYLVHIPKLGAFFLFLKTTPGYIICILIPFLLLILSQGINTIRLFRRYKQEQMQEMQAEKDKIAQDKEETQKMMAELLALKAQLAANGAVPDVQTPAGDTPPTDESKSE